MRASLQTEVRHRRGIETLEMIIVLPICIIVILALIQMGVALTVHHAVINVAAETARELSKIHEFDITNPDDIDAAEEVVNDILGVHGINLGDAGLLVVIEDSSDVVCLGDPALEPQYCPPGTSIVDNAEIKVTIYLLLENTPVPQFLKSFCIDFSDRRYEFSSIARKHCI